MFHPYGLGWGLIYFPERGKDISEKGGSLKRKRGALMSWKERQLEGSGWTLLDSVVSRKSFKQDWTG